MRSAKSPQSPAMFLFTAVVRMHTTSSCSKRHTHVCPEMALDHMTQSHHRLFSRLHHVRLNRTCLHLAVPPHFPDQGTRYRWTPRSPSWTQESPECYLPGTLVFRQPDTRSRPPRLVQVVVSCWGRRSPRLRILSMIGLRFRNIVHTHAITVRPMMPFLLVFVKFQHREEGRSQCSTPVPLVPSVSYCT